jgi:putative (di)nucleoside polyphosphate hydrolase
MGGIMMTDETEGLGFRPCVGIMVINPTGLVWIGRRPDAPQEPEGPGSWWQMPQGGIDENEDPRAAALRELYEETGLRSVEFVAEHPEWLYYDLPKNLVPRAWGGRYRGQKQKWFLMRFAGPDSEVQITPPPGHQIEFAEWRWAPLDTLTGLIVPFKRDVYRVVTEAFAPYVARAK